MPQYIHNTLFTTDGSDMNDNLDGSSTAEDTPTRATERCEREHDSMDFDPAKETPDTYLARMMICPRCVALGLPSGNVCLKCNLCFQRHCTKHTKEGYPIVHMDHTNLDGGWNDGGGGRRGGIVGGTGGSGTGGSKRTNFLGSARSSK